MYVYIYACMNVCMYAIYIRAHMYNILYIYICMYTSYVISIFMYIIISTICILILSYRCSFDIFAKLVDCQASY